MSNTVLCFYCKKNAANVKYVFKKTIYNKLNSEYGIGLTGIKKTTKYYEKEFLIDRCENCFIEHGKANKPLLITGLIAFLFTAIITHFFAKRIYIDIIVGIIAGIIAMVLYASLVYRKRIKKLGIIDENEIDEYGPIKDLLTKGWQKNKP